MLTSRERVVIRLSVDSFFVSMSGTGQLTTHSFDFSPRSERDHMRKIISILGTIFLILGPVTLASVAYAHAQAPTSQVRIGGVGFSSLGTGSLDLTPGVESVILLNYAYSVKGLKGYHLTDKAGNSVPLCAVRPVVTGQDGDTSTPTTPGLGTILSNCESTTADYDDDGVTNVNDSSEWISLTARSQMTINVEARNDGPWLNDGGDTVYLRNSVNRVLTKFVYNVSNPTS